MLFPLQRGEAKLLVEDWEGAVEDLQMAAQRSPQVWYYVFLEHFSVCTCACVFFLLLGLSAFLIIQSAGFSFLCCVVLSPLTFSRANKDELTSHWSEFQFPFFNRYIMRKL